MNPININDIVNEIFTKFDNFKDFINFSIVNTSIYRSSSMYAHFDHLKHKYIKDKNINLISLNTKDIHIIVEKIINDETINSLIKLCYIYLDKEYKNLLDKLIKNNFKYEEFLDKDNIYGIVVIKILFAAPIYGKDEYFNLGQEEIIKYCLGDRIVQVIHYVVGHIINITPNIIDDIFINYLNYGSICNLNKIVEKFYKRFLIIFESSKYHQHISSINNHMYLRQYLKNKEYITFDECIRLARVDDNFLTQSQKNKLSMEILCSIKKNCRTQDADKIDEYLQNL